MRTQTCCKFQPWIGSQTSTWRQAVAGALIELEGAFSARAGLSSARSHAVEDPNSFEPEPTGASGEFRQHSIDLSAFVVLCGQFDYVASGWILRYTEMGAPTGTT